eukprot:12875417-Alexandrium_andersonii.AAC.1
MVGGTGARGPRGSCERRRPSPLDLQPLRSRNPRAQNSLSLQNSGTVPLLANSAANRAPQVPS